MATSRALSTTLTNLTSSYSILNINARLALPTISFLTLRSSPAGRLASPVERTLAVVVRASSGSSYQEDDQEEDEGFRAPRKAEVDVLLSAAMELDGNGNCTCHTGWPALNDLVKILAHESQFDIKFQIATPLPPLPGTGLCMLHAVVFLLGQALSNALRGSLESLLEKKSNCGFTSFIPSAQIQARVELASHPRFFCSSQSSEQGEQCYELQVMQNFLHSFMKGSGIAILIDMDEQESTPKNVELAFKAFSSALGNATKKLVADLSMDNEAPQKAEVDMCLSAALNLDGSGNSDCETGLQFLDDLVNTLAHESQFNITIRTTRPQPEEMFIVHSIGFLLGQALVNALGGLLRVNAARQVEFYHNCLCSICTVTS